MNMSFLPSRHIVAFVIVPMATIFSLWLIGSIREQTQEKSLDQELHFQDTLAQAVDVYNTRDSDGDLLKDWEEFLYETDINNADSDSDGLDDYNEVLDPIRDPLVADAELGRYQASTSPEGENAENYYVYDASLTATEKFARDAMNTFAQLQDASGIGGNVQEVLLEKVSETVDERERKEGVYATEDIVLADIDSVENKEAYMRAFSRAVVPLSQISSNDLMLLALYTETNDQSYLEEMSLNAKRYNDFIENSLNIVVPPAIGQVHLELINHTHVLHENIQSMLAVDEDPLGAMIAAGDYTNDEVALETVIQALSLYFNSN